MIISIWYPSQSITEALTLGDLIRMHPEESNVQDSVLFTKFVAPIKWMFGQEMNYETCMRLIDIPTRSYRDAKPMPGRFPLVIALSEPPTYFATFEFLASHGYVVAGLQCKFNTDSPPPPLHYTRYTDVMAELLNYMEQQDNVKKKSISVFGHGFGINPALYLAMRTPRIKRAINVDGGFFGPRSNTTKSNDYQPDRLTIPLLHMITTSQQKEDDVAQFKALTNPITRVIIRPVVFKHQDISVWGRLVTLGLRAKEEIAVVNNVYVELHRIMLDFLKDKSQSNAFPDLQIEKFN